MPTEKLMARRGVVISTGLLAILFVGWLFAYEPVTRNVISTDAWCTYCHLDQEYNPAAKLSFSKPHPLEPVEGKASARCVDCHLPAGFWNATYAYTHYLSATDLLGHFRDREGERSGAWIPPAAARAYRVRNRLIESDSVTCSGCHVMAEIKPKRKRGERAHQKAVDEKQTCIECHNNLVHRFVEVRSESPAETEDDAAEATPAETPDASATADPFESGSFEGEPATEAAAEPDPFATEGFDEQPASGGTPTTETPVKDEFDQSFEDTEGKEQAR